MLLALVYSGGRVVIHSKEIPLRNSKIRFAAVSLIGGVAALVSGGCVVYTQPAYQPAVYQPAVYQPAPVAVEGPVFEAPGVVLIDVEPPPYERVYVYDPGYPPGCYLYGGFYYYGGYRYPHDVFINRYVTVNVTQNRYVNVEENRRQTTVIQERQTTEYQRTGGRPANRAGNPGSRIDDGRVERKPDPNHPY
jgi:hypothetical protein